MRRMHQKQPQQVHGVECRFSPDLVFCQKPDDSLTRVLLGRTSRAREAVVSGSFEVVQGRTQRNGCDVVDGSAVSLHRSLRLSHQSAVDSWKHGSQTGESLFRVEEGILLASQEIQDDRGKAQEKDETRQLVQVVRYRDIIALRTGEQTVTQEVEFGPVSCSSLSAWILVAGLPVPFVAWQLQLHRVKRESGSISVIADRQNPWGLRGRIVHAPFVPKKQGVLNIQRKHEICQP